jgi:hypothetical protein
MPNPHTTITPRTDQHHIRDVDLAFTFDNASLLPPLSRAGMPFNHLDTLDHNPAILGKDSYHLAPLITVAPCDDLDKVIFFDVRMATRYCFAPCHDG